jgi:hypothetical protein
MLPNYLLKNEIARPNNIINRYRMSNPLNGVSNLSSLSPNILKTLTRQQLTDASAGVLATATPLQLKGISNTAIAGLTVAQSKAIAIANPPIPGAATLESSSLNEALTMAIPLFGTSLRNVDKIDGGSFSIPTNSNLAALGPGVAITNIAGGPSVTSVQQVSPAIATSNNARVSQQVEALKANINTITYQIDLSGATGADANLPSTISMRIATVDPSTNIIVTHADDLGNNVSLSPLSSNEVPYPIGTIISAGIQGTTLFLNIIDGSGNPLELEGYVTVVVPAFSGAASIILTNINSEETSTLTAVPGQAGAFGGYLTIKSSYNISSGGGGGGVICFATGARILTQNGYKAVETLTPEDRLVTSDGRSTCFKLMSMTIDVTTSETAPYRIEAHAFGRNIPAAPVFLSPIHMMQIRKGVWTCPKVAVRENTNVKQYGVGESVTYYHVRCESYLRDNLVSEGMTVESFGVKKDLNGAMSAYTWNPRLKGFTRMTPSSITKHSH